MGRLPTRGHDDNGVKKGPWSMEEDQKLRAYIKRYGIWNWTHMPRFAGLARTGKSCRLRWMNYLRPNIKHGNFTKEEEDTIIMLQQRLGNRWSTIATKLPGRSDNEVKNYWNTYLRSRFSKTFEGTHGQLDPTCKKEIGIEEHHIKSIQVPGSNDVFSLESSSSNSAASSYDIHGNY